MVLAVSGAPREPWEVLLDVGEILQVRGCRHWLVTVGQVIGTWQVTHHRHGGHKTTKITVALEDDPTTAPADETVRFEIGGIDYAISSYQVGIGGVRGEMNTAQTTFPVPLSAV